MLMQALRANRAATAWGRRTELLLLGERADALLLTLRTR